MSNPTTKADIRAHWKKVPLPSPTEQADLNRRAVKWLVESPAFHKAGVVALFSPQLRELDLTDLWRQFPQKCVFPVAEKSQRKLTFYKISALSELASGFGGILEPPESARQKINEWKPSDLILVPGIVFDLRGFRLGSGMGFYDQFLSTQAPTPQRWGVAFDQQITAEPLPNEPHDIALQAICTPSGIRKITYAG